MASRGRGVHYGQRRVRETLGALEGKSVTGVLGQGEKTRDGLKGSITCLLELAIGKIEIKQTIVLLEE